jgi:hypothetical protein
VLILFLIIFLLIFFIFKLSGSIQLTQNTTVMENVKEKVNKINPTQDEGKVAREIEEQTSKIPSDVFLWASIGSMLVSLSLKIAGRSNTALFIGQWAPSFLIFGIYNKLVKQLGHDSHSM